MTRKKFMQLLLIVVLSLNVAGLLLAFQQGRENWLTDFLGGPSKAFCPKDEPLLSQHCFPDFGIFYYLPRSNPWGTEIAHPHPPLSHFFQTSFIDFFALFGADYWQTLTAWLALLVLSIYWGIVIFLIPSQGMSPRTFAIPLLLIGTLGPATILWTGNSAALAVPFLALASNGILMNSKYTWLWLAIALALRPQFLLLVIVLLVLKRFRQGALTILASLGVTLLSLTLLTGKPIPAGASWLQNLITFPFYASPFNYRPENLGIGRSLLKIPEGLTSLLGRDIETNDSSTRLAFIGEFLRIANDNRTIVLVIFGIIILAAVTLMRGALFSAPSRLSTFELVLLALLGGVVLPSTSFTYYLVVLLPATALVVCELLKDKSDGLTRSLNQFQKLALIWLTLLCPVPYSFLRSNTSLEPNAVFESFGLVLLALLYTLGKRIFSSRRN